MILDIETLKKYLLEVKVEPFIKSMQDAIDECPQGINDSTAYWAAKEKDHRYTPYNDSKEAIEYCFSRRMSLFTLESSTTLNDSGYFQFLSNTSKEIYHYAKIYQHLIKIKKLKNYEEK